MTGNDLSFNFGYPNCRNLHSGVIPDEGSPVAAGTGYRGIKASRRLKLGSSKGGFKSAKGVN